MFTHTHIHSHKLKTCSLSHTVRSGPLMLCDIILALKYIRKYTDTLVNTHTLTHTHAHKNAVILRRQLVVFALKLYNPLLDHR